MSVHEMSVREMTVTAGDRVRVEEGVADVFVAADHDVRLPLATLTAGGEVPGADGVELLVVGRGDCVLNAAGGEGSSDGVLAFLRASAVHIPALGHLATSFGHTDLPASLGPLLSTYRDSERVVRDARSARSTERDGRALADAYGRIAADIVQPGSARSPRGLGPLASVLAAIGEREGFTVVEPPPTRLDPEQFDPVAEIARASGVRYRPVELSGDWDRRGNSNYLAFLEHDGAASTPVALLHDGRGYTVQQPAAPTRTSLTVDLRAGIAPVAYEFYTPLPRTRRATWRNAVGIAMRGSRRNWTIALLCSLAVAVLGMATPLLTAPILATIIPEGRKSLLVAAGVGLVFAAAMAGAFAMVQGFAVNQISFRATQRVQASFWDRVLSLPPRFFRRYSSGDLAVRVLAVDQVQQIISGQVITTLLAGVFTLVQLYLIFHYSPMLALVALGTLAASVISIVLATRALSRLARQTLQAQRRSNSWLVQLLTGVGKVRIAGAEDRFTGQYIDYVREEVVASARQTAVVGNLSAAFAFITALGPALFFVTIGATWVGSKPEISTATYVAFVSAYSIVFAAVASLTSVVASLATVGPTLEMVQPILDELPEGATHQDEPGTISGEIELRHVSFRYGEDTPLVLRDIDVRIGAGEMVALVGPSGSGKSSISRLILGFDEPEEGQVLIDGRDLVHLDLDAVRAQFGVVLQDGKIMRGTMQDNILGGAALGESEAWAAAEAAALAADVRALPMGMMTMVDPANVSGGQAQRILLARALVRQPSVIILDEATSALDNESQAHVTDALDALGATRIVIAHRLSTIRNADRIIVIVKGAVVEQGSFDELMAADGTFAALARRQLA